MEDFLWFIYIFSEKWWGIEEPRHGFSQQSLLKRRTKHKPELKKTVNKQTWYGKRIRTRSRNEQERRPDWTGIRATSTLSRGSQVTTVEADSQTKVMHLRKRTWSEMRGKQDETLKLKKKRKTLRSKSASGHFNKISQEFPLCHMVQRMRLAHSRHSEGIKKSSYLSSYLNNMSDMSDSLCEGSALVCPGFTVQSSSATHISKLSSWTCSFVISCFLWLSTVLLLQVKVVQIVAEHGVGEKNKQRQSINQWKPAEQQQRIFFTLRRWWEETGSHSFILLVAGTQREHE